MASIVFFISGHGFGHASRQVEIINALAARRPGTRIVIRSAVSPALLARTVRPSCDLRPGATDVGVVQRDSVTHDDEATAREAIGFYRDFDARVRREVEALGGTEIDLVVGDIPPLAFAVAAALGVPSMAIANFTWDWIYDGMPALIDEAPWLSPLIRRAYASATRALALPFTAGFDVFRRVEPIPLVARRATRTPADTRRRFALPPTARVALLSFGGYGLPSLNLSALDCLDAWTIVTTDTTSGAATSRPPGVVHINESAFVGGGFRYEDLVAAVDVVVTKPGYGIIAECAANGPAMLYTSRGAFREYDVLVAGMPRYIRSRFIAQPDLFAGRWRGALDAVLAAPAPPSVRVDGTDVAAAAIDDLLTSGAR